MREQALRDIELTTQLEDLQQIKTKYLGKNGHITSQLKTLGQLEPDARKARGAEINQLKQEIETALGERMKVLQEAALNAQLQAESLDVTLPGVTFSTGGSHITSRILEDLERIFFQMGYQSITGNEIEEETYNFDALNIPWYHPARDLWDTFWLTDGRLLRTHTSPMQIRHMIEHEPPFKIIVPGKVYRYEVTDATHESMFHQLEGLVIGDRVSMAQLKGTIAELGRGLFGANSQVRFQPSYYPFVEPGADFSIWWDNPKGESKWLELGGCGMVHPNVLKAADDFREALGKPRIYEGKTGFAFGLGVERIAMLKYGVPDIRYFYQNDLRVLTQFRGSLESGA